MHTPDTFFEPESHEQGETQAAKSVLLFEKPKFDSESPEITERLQRQNIRGLKKARVGKLYVFKGYSDEEVTRIKEYLYEPDHMDVYEKGSHTEGTFVCVGYKPQVTNPELDSLQHALRRKGISTEGKSVDTAMMVFLEGNIDDKERERAEGLLVNPVVQRPLNRVPSRLGVQEAQHSNVVQIIPLRAMTMEQMMQLSNDRRLFLSERKLLCIQNHFSMLGRDPKDLELETLAQTWSEHCGHETFNAEVTINGVLKKPFMKRLKDVTSRIGHPGVVSCFKDNAGVVRFDETHGIAAKWETHNAPSAVEPFGGADTGLGGVIRDAVATGKGGWPISGSDVLFFGDPGITDAEVLPGCLHPETLLREVVHGIRNYGDKMGLANVSGALQFHPGFVAKPGVLAGCISIIPLEHAQKGEALSGDYLISIGGKTGKDGVHGATFSSAEMTASTSTLDGASVQIGYPVRQRETIEVIQILRDEGITHAITDCGAGGYSSACTEMNTRQGAEIQLDNASTKYEGLMPWELWISEAQERFVLAVPEDKVSRVRELCAQYGISCDHIGVVGNGNGRLKVWSGQTLAADLDLDFALNGNPIKKIEGTYEKPPVMRTDVPRLDPTALRELLLRLLGHLNVASREGIIRGYDHSVSGAPLSGFYEGRKQDAPQDGIILRPKPGVNRGVMTTHGLAPEIGEHDPFEGAVSSVVEAIANAVSRGADIHQMYLSDNFMHPTPDNPEDIGTLDRTVDGLVFAVEAFGTPIITGKDSLGMRFGRGAKAIKAPPTLVVSAVSIFDDVDATVQSHFQEPGNTVILVGVADPAQLAGSAAADLLELKTNAVPTHDDLRQQRDIFLRMHDAIRSGKISSCHDVRSGGLMATLSEMTFGNELGVDVELPGSAENAVGTLASEKAGRFVVELRPGVDPVQLFSGLPVTVLGTTTNARVMNIALPSQEKFSFDIDELKKANRHPLLERVFPFPREPEGPKPDRKPSPPPVDFRVSKAGAPRVLVVRGPGSNRDRDLAESFRRAGAVPKTVLITDLTRQHFKEHQILGLPGGFLYGDDLGSGKVAATDLVEGFRDELGEFLDEDKLALFICNGHQVALRAGIMPFRNVGHIDANSLLNVSGRFVSRRVDLRIEDSICKWTQALRGKILRVPVAHAEGRFHASDQVLALLEQRKQIALRYVDAGGQPTEMPPFNPNGSPFGIAGITDDTGRLLSQMPHVESDPRNFHPKAATIDDVIGLDVIRGGVQYFG